MNDVKPNESSNSAVRCGIILSAGDGRRMRDFVYRQRGDHLPKQYINFIGKRSMLEHTFERAEKLIPAQRLFVVIAKEHLQFDAVRRQIASRPRQCVVIQPQNKDTGPGLLLPLLYVYKQYPEAAVAVFPSDHFILEEDLFIQHVDRAFRVVESDGSRIVLLGMEPNEPDPEYGYIVPGETIDDPGLDGARKVEMFVEKPSAEAAKKIIKRRALWNTLVFVVRCHTLLQAIQRATPELYRSFEPIQNAIGTADEQRVIEEVYHKLPSLNFSKGVLEALSFEHRQALAVIPVSRVTWSDWGVSDRLSSMLRQLGKSDYVRPERVLSEGGVLPVSSANRMAALRRIQ
ncbi:MAG TPA: sugar phosphate nucleotidyltransferase [Methylomirabilota bacterium]|nr:sugar phosphate nucleotidyltransferase [Methylomirabilota bacterium]